MCVWKIFSESRDSVVQRTPYIADPYAGRYKLSSYTTLQTSQKYPCKSFHVFHILKTWNRRNCFLHRRCSHSIYHWIKHVRPSKRQTHHRYYLFGFAYRRRKSVHRLVCFVSSNSQLLNCRSFRELCGRPSKLIISYFHWITFVYNSMHSSFESTWHKHSWRLTGRDKQKLCGWSFSLLRIVFKKNIHS